MASPAGFTQWWAASALLLTPALLVSGDVPRLINYQGKLSDSSGNCFSGTVSLRLRLYDAASAGNGLFDETQSGIAVNQGLLSVLIGLATSGGVPDPAIVGS